ncbi:MAG: sigma-54-dependent Fis family transcriptional regulator [Desulfobacteraceae bacterium]|nr:sigma-54-dependent Fis family transcriptional regulator [Desulfobacteraceae bacterium]
MDTTKILIVDDTPIIRESLSGWLQRANCHVRTATDGKACLEMLKKHRFDILLMDITMDEISGMEVLRHVKEFYPDMDVIMITAVGSIASAVAAMKAGAYDYLLKPFALEKLEVLIERLMDHREKKQENLFLREQHREQTRFESIIGQSAPMQEIFSLIHDIRDCRSTVLISGETGTGKGLAAKAIHTNSPVEKGPLVNVNCGAIPPHLMESELFGHQKGAFTDAKETRKGRLEMANNGTLFLDEIGEISMRMQIDLLQVLEDKVFYKVGGTQPITTNFRVIAATNRDIHQAMAQKVFRKDLFYRLNVISFTMPPLRNRREDIPLLADHFLRKFAQETNKNIHGINRRGMDELMLYDWPGNVRELSNAIERAVVVCKCPTIEACHLPMAVPDGKKPPRERLTLAEIEQGHIELVLCKNHWNIAKSASILGIDRSTLYNKIRKYCLRKNS